MNAPLWPHLTQKPGNGCHEAWYFKFNDPGRRQGMLLRFTVLATANGFKRAAEVWAVFYRRRDNGEVEKTAVRRTHDLSEFVIEGDTIRVGGCEFSPSHTSGSIQTKGLTLSWDLKIAAPTPLSFDFVPELLSRLSLVTEKATTPQEALTVTGTYAVGTESFSVAHAPGCQGHFGGSKHADSWVWGHCNHFTDAGGGASDLVFDGLTARTRLPGGFRSPKMSAFFIRYEGKRYDFNGVLDAMRLRSSHTLTEWRFQADQGLMSFRGHLRASLRDFAGLTYEDTDGTFLYCATTTLSDLTVAVYRDGKLQNTLTARDGAAFEVVGRNKNPYVPMIL